MPSFKSVSVIGAGAWGTALALAARRADREVVLWSHRADQIETMWTTRENAEYLPGQGLDAGIRIPGALADLADC